MTQAPRTNDLPLNTIVINGNSSVRDDWRSRADSRTRYMILTKMIQIAKRNEKFSSSFSNKRVFMKVMMSFENALYYSATSFNQYSDLSTLANRIKMIIMRYCKECGSRNQSREKIHSRRESQEGVKSQMRRKNAIRERSLQTGGVCDINSDPVVVNE